MCVCVCARTRTCTQSLSCVLFFVTPWTVACQAPLSMGFSRLECWSGLPFPTPGIFLTQGSNLSSLHLLHWQMDSLLLRHWEALTEVCSSPNLPQSKTEHSKLAPEMTLWFIGQGGLKSNTKQDILRDFIRLQLQRQVSLSWVHFCSCW